MLWQAVRRKALGVRIRRQQPIGPYRVDFYVAKCRLIIEIDGPVHELQEAEDRERQRDLESLGFQFLRIPAEDVLEDLIGVLTRIRRSIESNH